jgi:hypothetical protein
MEAAIQIGESTHHHDQDILPINFSVMKTIVRSPTNPIPPFELLELLLISLSYAPRWGGYPDTLSFEPPLRRH